MTRVGQSYARERRRREVGRSGCDDCGVRLARVRGMIGTAAARVRCCSECWMYRSMDQPWEGAKHSTEIGQMLARRQCDA